MSTKKIILICLGILGLAAVVIFLIYTTEPVAQSEGTAKKTAILVDVIKVEKGNFKPLLPATGTVLPVEDVILSPLLSGPVIKRSESFIPGGFVSKGEILLQIEPSDYRNILELRKSELLQAETDLKIEMGRQEVAEKDLALIGSDSLSEQQRALVLRKPQLDAVRASIKAARASVEQARLELERTTLRAPFDAHILRQDVTLGSRVSPGDDLGRLVGADYYWVELNVPVNQLPWLEFPGAGEEKGSAVRVRNASGWPENTYRTGYLYRQVGALDNQTRLARVLVRVPDPLAQKPEAKDKPELMIGSFVSAELQGREIEEVIRLERDYLRNDQTVWVMENDKLSIRDVEVVLTDHKYAYISKGLEENELVVTTNLSTVAEGIPLRTEQNNADKKSEEANTVQQ